MITAVCLLLAALNAAVAAFCEKASINWFAAGFCSGIGVASLISDLAR